MLKKIPFKNILIIGFILIGYIVLLKLTGMTCLIKSTFGVSCPGCGMTRACFSALTFNFKQAFYYHPLWIIMIPSIVLLFYLWIKDKKRLFKLTIGIIIILFIIVYIIRLIFGDQQVVYIDFTKGYIYDLIQNIKNLFK